MLTDFRERKGERTVAVREKCLPADSHVRDGTDQGWNPATFFVYGVVL